MSFDEDEVSLFCVEMAMTRPKGSASSSVLWQANNPPRIKLEISPFSKLNPSFNWLEGLVDKKRGNIHNTRWQCCLWLEQCLSLFVHRHYCVRPSEIHSDDIIPQIIVPHQVTHPSKTKSSVPHSLMSPQQDSLMKPSPLAPRKQDTSK